MSTKTQNQKTTPITETKTLKAFIGIDYHKRYSVYHVVDETGKDVAKGRIDHARPDEFGKLVERFPGCRVAFEASMNCLCGKTGSGDKKENFSSLGLVFSNFYFVIRSFISFLSPEPVFPTHLLLSL